jgi:hypothetical protein
MYIGDFMELMLKEIRILHHKVDMIVQKEAENNIEEISLCRACRLLHKGSETVLELVKNGQLKALTYVDTAGRTRYRFRMSDIHKYQTPGLYDPAVARDYTKIKSKKTRLTDEEQQEYRHAIEDLKKRVLKKS